MSGRGDNNKHGSAGRGASNQSKQGVNEKEQGVSNGNKNLTGGRPSQPSPRTADEDSNRNQPLKDRKQKEK